MFSYDGALGQAVVLHPQTLRVSVLVQCAAMEQFNLTVTKNGVQIYKCGYFVRTQPQAILLFKPDSLLCLLVLLVSDSFCRVHILCLVHALPQE